MVARESRKVVEEVEGYGGPPSFNAFLADRLRARAVVIVVGKGHGGNVVGGAV